MVAYSFKGRFGEPILSGTKKQTIRANRKRHARPGEQIQLYTGMRTRFCKLLMKPSCEDVKAVKINVEPLGIWSIEVDGVPVADLDAFARADGFKDITDMSRFWLDAHGAGTFEGVVICWSEPVKEDAGVPS